MRTFPPSLRGALATKQSGFSFGGGDGLLRPIERAFAPDWLAMTSQDMHPISPNQALLEQTYRAIAQGERARPIIEQGKDHDNEVSDGYRPLGEIQIPIELVQVG
jgi:hypothetical protein